jgi:hypothetical protein
MKIPALEELAYLTLFGGLYAATPAWSFLSWDQLKNKSMGFFFVFCFFFCGFSYLEV